MTDLSFDPLVDMIDSLANYSQALKRGNDTFLDALPIILRQTVNKLASERLDHTAEDYKQGVNVEYQGDLLVVLIKPENWLATALETGAKSWPMVDSHLSGPKTKTSKDGFKYKVIPIRVWGSSPNAKTELGQQFFDMAKKTLTKPKMKSNTVKMDTKADGSVTVRQQVQTEFKELQGLESVRSYNSVADFQEKKRPTHSKFVLFRTMSEKHPEKFVHPGIQARNILKDAQTALEDKLSDLWEASVQKELG